MNIHEFAKKLSGRTYGVEMIGTEEQQAKELGFVVVFGQSDDLTEFRGAIYGEVDCWEGANIYRY
jgi:sorbitol-specific phosphotransferase system component IIA